jgi:hypothetical protein
MLILLDTVYQVTYHQGDQMSRMLGHWSIVNFGLWFEYYIQKWSKFLTTFFRGTSCVLTLTQKWLGYILGDFFTNSCGHPAYHLEIWRIKEQLIKRAQSAYAENGRIPTLPSPHPTVTSA